MTADSRALEFDVAQYAWQLFVDIRPDDVVLDVDCGTGGLAQNIAPRVALTCALGRSHEQVDSARHRLAAGGVLDAVQLIVCRNPAHLPFSDDSIDVVFVSDAYDLDPDRIRELRRVLRHDGRLFVRGRNDWRSGILRRRARTLGACRRRLRRAGFRAVEAIALVPDHEHVEAIQVLDMDLPFWDVPVPGGLKERLKRSALFVPAYGLVAGNQTGPECGLQRLLSAVARDLDVLPGGYSVIGFDVSPKGKVIIRSVFGGATVYVRVPLGAAAAAAEARHRSMLEHLAAVRAAAPGYPCPLAHGFVAGLEYFVESEVSGCSVREGIGRLELETHLADVASLLQNLNSPVGPELSLDGPSYEFHVGTGLRALRSVLDDRTSRALDDFFDRHVRGLSVRTGLTHGDFGVSNVMIDHDGQVTGVIDWEYGAEAGLPVLDAINYVASLYQLRAPQTGFTDCLRWLQEDANPTDPLRRFLAQHSRQCGLIADRDLLPYVSLWWLHVATCRLGSGMLVEPEEVRKFVADVIERVFGIR